MDFEGVGHYVEGALRLLQFIETRRPTGRRFGPDADARWNGFKGDLETVDRIELMIRDADAEWPGGFGARLVFAIHGVAEDEPFGSQWKGLDPVDAEELWRRVKTETPPSSIARTLEAIAAAWKITLRKHRVEAVAATDKLVITGPSAIAASIEAFSKGTALDWADQVVVVATDPAPRHLAISATALLNAQRAVTIVASSDDAPKLPRGARLEISSDVSDADRSTAESLVKR